MTKIISKFRNSLTGEEFVIAGAGEGGGSFDPAIVEQIYANLRKEIEGAKTELQEEIKRNEMPLYTDKTIEEVKELLGDDINIGKTVAVVENERVVEYCWQPLSESIEFYIADIEEYVIAIRSYANDIKGEYDLAYYAWVNGDNLYYTNSIDDVVSKKTDEAMLEVASSYEKIVNTAGFVRKTVFYYENNSEIASINGKEVMRITADGSLRLSDGNGFTATISPRQLAALVATLN